MNSTSTKLKKATPNYFMPIDWKLLKLADVSSLITKGTTPTTLGGKFTENGIRFIKVENLSDEGKISNDKNTYIDEKTHELLKRSVLHENDILYSIAGTIGRVAIVEKEYLPANTNQAVAIIRPDLSKISLKYLKYFLLSPLAQANLTSKVVHAVQANLSLTELGNCLISYPEINEQELIAQILSSLDEKIELNNDINIKLEEISSTIFKKSFLDIQVNQLPESWKISPLGNFLDILNGFAFKSEDYSEEGIFLLRTSNFEGNGYANNDDTIFLPEEFSQKYSNYLLRKFDVLLVMVGASIGKTSMVTSKILPALQNQNMWNFRAKDQRNQLFVKFLIDDVVKNNIGSATGSARDFFRKDYFKKINFVLPDQSSIDKFVEQVSPLFNQIDKNLIQIEVLKKIKKLLLPRLMNGSIRVMK